MDAARIAGIIAAKNAATASEPAATISASDPNWKRRKAPTKLMAGADGQRQPENQTNRDAQERAAESIERLFARFAPSAMRMPISLVRCATV